MTVRELNGWSPSSVTYGPGGEVLSVTVQEPRFTVTEKALLLAARRSSLAPRGAHGLLLSEATDAANQFAYRVPPPTRDWAQAKLNEARSAYAKAYPDADMDSLLFRVEQVT